LYLAFVIDHGVVYLQADSFRYNRLQRAFVSIKCINYTIIAVYHVRKAVALCTAHIKTVKLLS